MTPQPITLEGRTGTVLYIDANFKPVEKTEARLARVVFDDGGSAFYTISQTKAAGGHGSGNFHHAGRPGEVGGSEEGVRNERSQRALKYFKPIHAAAQQHAEANELEVRQMVGGTRTDDNLPIDVMTTIEGKFKGIEVKTLINNTNDKITMRAAAIEKKEAWARSNHATVHTVVLDDRGKFGNAGYSGHRLYYRKGYGSFRLNAMTPVKNAAHLKKLLAQ